MSLKHEENGTCKEELGMFARGPVVVFKWRNQEDWPVEYVSPNVKELLGYTEEDFLHGRVLYADIVHPEDIERVRDEVAHYTRGQVERFHHEPYRLIARRGDVVWVLDYITIQRDEAGNITHYVGYVVDITEMKRIEEALQKSEARYRILFDSAPDAVFVLDPQGVIVECSHNAAVLYGYPREDLIGRHMTELMTPVSIAVFQENFPKLKRFEQTEAEVEVVRGDGGICEIAYKGVPLKDEDGNFIGVFAYQRDITGQKRAENALLQRDAILTAVARAAEMCPRHANFDESANAILTYLGEATRVSRVYVFENHVDENGRLLTSQRYEWVAPGITPRINNPELQNFPLIDAGFGRWVEKLSRNEVIYALVKDLPGSERQFLEAQDIVSIAIVPIFVADEWWGFMGFHECHTERQWSKAEIEALRVAAGVFSAAIQRKSVEDALRRREELLRTLINATPDIICFKDGEGRWLEANKADLRLFQLEDVDYQGKKDSELARYSEFYHDAFMTCEETDEKAWEKGRLSRSIEVIPRPDGSKKVYDVIKVPLFEEDGRRKGLVVLGRDITEMKKAEEELKENEKRYHELSTLLRLMADNLPDMLWAKNLNKEYIFANKAICRDLLNAKDTQEPLGKTDLFFAERERKAHPDNPNWHTFGELCVDSDAVTLEAMKPMHFDEFGYVKGKLLCLDVHKAPLFDSEGKLIGVVGSARDVTAAREAEKQLLKLSTAVEQSPSMIVITDTQGNIEYANPRSTEITGYTPEEAIGKNIRILQLGEDPPGVYGAIWETISSGRTWHGEFYKRKKTGEMFWIMVSISPIFDPKGKIINYVLVGEDITQRKFAEEQLHNEREKLLVTLQSIGDGVITTDTQGRVVFMNAVAEELTGWRKEEALGEPSSKIFYIINEKTREPAENPLEKVMRAGKPVGLSNHIALIARDGTKRTIENSGAPILDREGKIIGVVLVFRDVTEQRRIEEEQLKIKKLESLGVLAGGIAHDFNNILAAILGNINLAELYIGKDHKAQRLLKEAEKASLRARDLTQQLLTFSKGGEPVKETASIKEVITESADFVLHGTNLRCRYLIPDDLWLVSIDKGQMSQVIQNLVINARQAMPEGGEITITCENCLDITAETGLELEGGRYIKITVTDTGCGIPSKYLDRIFDPYFTTKQQGSGLGLAITHSIIRKHGGHITAQSRPGHGTTFTIYLPASSEQVPKDSGDDVQESETTEQVTILVMDDEEMIRDLTKEALSLIGHEVLVAQNGEEAISIYKERLQSDNPVDAIIMDLNIRGGMGGKEAIKEILKIDPGAKAIVSSGYANDPVIANYSRYGFKGALQKPFKIEQLKKTLNSVLGDVSG